jgi:hypothetical protein
VPRECGVANLNIMNKGRKNRLYVAWLLSLTILGLMPDVGYASGEPVGSRYSVDSAHSLVRIYVYRAGLLSFLGHDHLITASVITGELRFTPPPALAAAFSLSIPVAGLVVDDPQQRHAAGGRFGAPVAAEDRAGTRHNMLGDNVLDAVQYPIITVTGRWLGGSASHGRVAVTLGVHGGRHDYRVPVNIQLQAQDLRVTGKLHLRQSQLGITPFGIFGGALQVADGIDVQFSFTFVPVEDSPRRDPS